MKSFLLLLPLLALVAGCPLPNTPPVPADIAKSVNKTTNTKYYTYIPSYYTADRDWPLVITLHGSAGWDGPYRQAKEWEYLAEKRGLIVVAPDLRSAEGVLPLLGRQSRYEDDERNVLAILEEVCDQYRIDRQHVLLTGFSAGGYPLYFIGLRNPDKFSMLISRSGNCDEEMFENLQLTPQARKLRVMVFFGKDDLANIKSDGWYAYRWLRQNGVKNAKLKKLKAGHIRRPQYAYLFWKEHLPARHRMDHFAQK